MNNNKIELPTVTLVCIDDLNSTRALKAINSSTKHINYGDVKYLTSKHIECPNAVKIDYDITSKGIYSKFCIYDLYKYIDTQHMLIVQHDGFVMNPNKWNDVWLNYDYVGGNHPHFGLSPDSIGGNGGFSLRSNRLMKACSDIFDRKQELKNEDLRICDDYSKNLIGMGFRFASRKVQEDFSVEHGMYNGAFGHHVQNISTYKKLVSPDRWTL